MWNIQTDDNNEEPNLLYRGLLLDKVMIW
jgi:hypothetical protein